MTPWLTSLTTTDDQAPQPITHAVDRATGSESTTGIKTLAVVIGEHIPGHQETRANAMNVALIQIAE